jgi:hypothetical protein
LGRFTQQDPIPSLNNYAYSAGDPIDNSDPSGQFWLWIGGYWYWGCDWGWGGCWLGRTVFVIFDFSAVDVILWAFIYALYGIAWAFLISVLDPIAGVVFGILWAIVGLAYALAIYWWFPNGFWIGIWVDFGWWGTWWDGGSWFNWGVWGIAGNSGCDRWGWWCWM